MKSKWKTDISKVMNAYISNQEMLGGALIVRKNDEIIYQNKWGFQNLEHSRSIEYDTNVPPDVHGRNV